MPGCWRRHLDTSALEQLSLQSSVCTARPATKPSGGCVGTIFCIGAVLEQLATPTKFLVVPVIGLSCSGTPCEEPRHEICFVVYSWDVSDRRFMSVEKPLHPPLGNHVLRVVPFLHPIAATCHAPTPSPQRNLGLATVFVDALTTCFRDTLQALVWAFVFAPRGVWIDFQGDRVHRLRHAPLHHFRFAHQVSPTSLCQGLGFRQPPHHRRGCEQDQGPILRQVVSHPHSSVSSRAFVAQVCRRVDFAPASLDTLRTHSLGCLGTSQTECLRAQSMNGQPFAV